MYLGYTSPVHNHLADRKLTIESVLRMVHLLALHSQSNEST